MLLCTYNHDYQDLTTQLIKSKIDNGYRSILLSCNTPYMQFFELFEKNSIPKDKTFIIDCKFKGNSKLQKDENVFFIDDISALTDISITINECMRSVSGKKFVIIDNINSLLHKNDMSILVKFLHSIVGRFIFHGVSGILITIDSEVKDELKGELKALCSEIIIVPNSDEEDLLKSLKAAEALRDDAKRQSDQ